MSRPNANRIESFRRAIAIVALAIFVIPICTNALGYLYSEAEILRIRPALVVAATGAMALFSVMPSVPRPPLAILSFLSLLIVRFADALFFKRIYDPSDYAKNVTGYSVILVIVLMWVLEDRRRRELLAIWIIVPCLAVTIFTIAWDVMYPGTFSAISGRASGIFLNSNNAALATALFCSYLMGRFSGNLLHTALWMGIGLFGTFVTYSRGGFFVMLVSIVVFLIRNMTLRKGVLFAFLLLSSGLGLDQLAQSTISADDTNSLNRSQVMLGRARLDYDDTGRIRVLLDGLDMCLKQPLVGYGATYSAAPQVAEGLGPHNMIVAAWMDSGIVGLFLFSASLVMMLIYVARRSREYLPLASALTVATGFSHNLLEFAPYILGWVLVVYGAREERQRTAESASISRREALRIRSSRRAGGLMPKGS